jgi:hypothetical protein
MKNIVVLIALAIAVCVTSVATAQVWPKTELTSVKHAGKTVNFTITAPKPFIYGSNRYILHIGDHNFFQHQQSAKKGKGMLVFAVPAEDLAKISDGSKMFVTYGDAGDGEQELEDAAKQNNKRCAALGKLNKKSISR